MTKPTPHEKAIYYDSLWEKPIEKIENDVLRKKRENKCDWMYDVEIKFLNDLKSIKNVGESKACKQKKIDRHGMLLPHQQHESKPRNENYILKEGEFWELGFKGKNIHLKVCQGLKYIEFLIQHQSQPISPEQMVRLSGDVTMREDNDDGLSVSGMIGIEEATDARTIRTCKMRLIEIEDKLKQINVDSENAKVKSLIAEKENIEKYLKETTRFGKIKMQSRESKKNINTISKAIQRALTKIQKENIELWRHLNKSITTGQYFGYTPEEKTQWSIK